VPNKIDPSQEGDSDELAVQLAFKSIRDFEPDRLAEQVPELKKLLAVREALVSLKGPLGNVPAFRKKLQSVVKDPEALKKLYAELGIDQAGESQEGNEQ